MRQDLRVRLFETEEAAHHWLNPRTGSLGVFRQNVTKFSGMLLYGHFFATKAAPMEQTEDTFAS